MSLYETLFAAEVTIGTVAFVFLPLVAQLAYDNKIFLSRRDIRLIKINSIVVLFGIFLLFFTVYFEHNKAPWSIESLNPVLPVLAVGVFCLSVFVTFFIGFLLLGRIIPT